jgi:hypothetical protein
MSEPKPKLGDFVRFAHPTHPAWAALSGFIIMIITEVDQPTRCEVMVSHGNCGRRTFHWRRADQLTWLAGPDPNYRLRYDIRHRDVDLDGR